MTDAQEQAEYPLWPPTLDILAYHAVGAVHGEGVRSDSPQERADKCAATVAAWISEVRAGKA